MCRSDLYCQGSGQPDISSELWENWDSLEICFQIFKVRMASFFISPQPLPDFLTRQRNSNPLRGHDTLIIFTRGSSVFASSLSWITLHALLNSCDTILRDYLTIVSSSWQTYHGVC